MKILVLCLPGIGDGLMATPMIRLLRKKYPDAVIDVACMFGGVGYVFEHNHYVTHTYSLRLYKHHLLGILLQLWPLRKARYDISFLAFPAYRLEYHLVQRFIAAKRRIATRFSHGYWREANFFDTDLVDIDEQKHNVINNLQLLHPLGIDWKREVSNDTIRYTLDMSKTDMDYGKAYIKKLGWKASTVIGIHPGSTDSKAALLRRWSIERYAIIAKDLIKNNKNILLFTGPDEIQLGEELYKLIANTKHCVLVNTTFPQAVSVLSTVSLLLCNDNGFGHLAVGLGKPIITLWASTNDRWSLPYDATLVTLIRPKGYVPWYRYDLKREVPEQVKDGMDEISVEQVEKELKRLNYL